MKKQTKKQKKNELTKKKRIDEIKKLNNVENVNLTYEQKKSNIQIIDFVDKISKNVR